MICMSDTKINKQFGERLASIRKGLKLSQEELAEKANCSPTHLSDIERGIKSPRLELILNLAKGLNVSASELFINIDIVNSFNSEYLNSVNMLLNDLYLNSPVSKFKREILSEIQTKSISDLQQILRIIKVL